MNEPESTTYTASLNAVNSSGVTADANITVTEGRMSINIESQGTAAQKVHAQHIHGVENSTSSCPSMSADDNEDGLISVAEGAPSYGGILVPMDGSLQKAEGLGDLETFPTANSEGQYSYQMSISTENLDVNEDRSFEDLTLQNHAIVIHGRTVDGEYKAKLPVACGTLSEAN